MRKLVEKHRRRPEFDAESGVPVRLANGEEWVLPRPYLEIRPIFRGGAAVARSRFLTCGELDPLIETIGRAEDPAAQILAVMTLGALLLRRNYDLADADLERLFVYRVGDPASEAMIRGIMDVATGKLSRVFGRGAFRDPKPHAAGSGSA
jgi:hypothetical protein